MDLHARYLQPSKHTAKVLKVQILQSLSIFFQNLSNNALWISYSAVANVSADYFQKDVNTDIDLLSTISFYVGIPMCLVSTYVVDALGFRTGQSPPLLSCLPPPSRSSPWLCPHIHWGPYSSTQHPAWSQQ